MFADLKKYLFTYRLLVPTMKVDNVRVLSQSKLSDVFKDVILIFYFGLEWSIIEILKELHK